ncbi:MAG: carbamoyl-phosphate synthase large subunit, partial [Tepidisphaeraceae bacterium]
ADRWLRSLTRKETGEESWPIAQDKLRRKLAVPSQGRLYYIRYALKQGWSIDHVHELTHIDRWFLAQMKQLVDFEDRLLEARATLKSSQGAARVPPAVAQILRQAKHWGYGDIQLAFVLDMTLLQVRAMRESLGINPVYKLVDTCAAEFEAATPYYYSTYETPFATIRDQQSTVETEDEIRLTGKPKVIIIGGGPNRIGQGIEFDYCCVQAAFAMKELGFESVMLNSNPETVSTDYDTSDLLFFEPLTHEDVLNVCERLNGGPFNRPQIRNPKSEIRNLVKGVVVQFGGQTPLNLARGLHEAGVPIIGTTVDSLDIAGDREKFRELLHELGLKQPANGIARSVEDARRVARRIGYPVLVRPSFVLGGRAMEIVSDDEQLEYYMAHAVEAASGSTILVDKFLDSATEVDVDCIADYSPAAGKEQGRCVIIGVMEHIEEAGIHSGDSACALPPYSLAPHVVRTLKDQTRALARVLRVRGLMNVQYAVKDSRVYVIEVNPRASRTVPFVGKATGIPWAKFAAKVMIGKSLDELGVNEMPDPTHVSVKESVFPFSKFPGVDIVLGPEMKSTGEVMGIDRSFALAFAKSQIAAGSALPTSGTVFISVRDSDKAGIVPIAKWLSDLGLSIIATGGTFEALHASGVPAQRVGKLSDERPNILDWLSDNRTQLIINTPSKKGPQTDEGVIRSLAMRNNIPIITTLTAARAAAGAIRALRSGDWGVLPLQEYSV